MKLKTPEDIKKGLELCSADYGNLNCNKCTYESDPYSASCITELEKDALAYIQQLERERDAAVADMTELMQLAQFCRHCKHLTDDGECTNDFADTDGMPWRCWQWRGVQEVE